MSRFIPSLAFLEQATKVALLSYAILNYSSFVLTCISSTLSSYLVCSSHAPATNGIAYLAFLAKQPHRFSRVRHRPQVARAVSFLSMTSCCCDSQALYSVAMSLLSPFSYLIDNPKLQVAAGASVLFGLPIAQVALSTTAPLAGGFTTALPLYCVNILSFAINCTTVSVPGRLDGLKDAAMRKGDLNPSAHADDTAKKASVDSYTRARDRSLITPSGWAFAIWGPIYFGEAIFCVAQCIPASNLTHTVLPHVTAPFVAVNLFQSLWCASFRPESFNGTWTTFVGPVMLAGAAYSMSHVNAFAASNVSLVPLSVHFGWLTAATLVNLNSSLAAMHESDTLAIATGHASVVMACILGVGVTLSHGTPAYGLTLAWALTACGTGLASRSKSGFAHKVQKVLCFAGAGICAASSVVVLLRRR